MQDSRTPGNVTKVVAQTLVSRQHMKPTWRASIAFATSGPYMHLPGTSLRFTCLRIRYRSSALTKTTTSEQTKHHTGYRLGLQSWPLLLQPQCLSGSRAQRLRCSSSVTAFLALSTPRSQTRHTRGIVSMFSMVSSGSASSYVWETNVRHSP